MDAPVFYLFKMPSHIKTISMNIFTGTIHIKKLVNFAALFIMLLSPVT